MMANLYAFPEVSAKVCFWLRVLGCFTMLKSGPLLYLSRRRIGWSTDDVDQ